MSPQTPIDQEFPGRPLGSVRLPGELRALVPFEVGDSVELGVTLQGPPIQAGVPPVQCSLVMVADIRHVPLADTLGLLHSASGSGLLLFSYGDHAKAVYLHRGEVVFASSNRTEDRLGECLVRAGKINVEQLREAERHFQPGQRFGKVMVERGILAPRELWHGVKYQVEEIVRSLFSYTAGTVYLIAGELKPDNVVRLSLPTQRLVEEGVQQRDELQKFLALLEEPAVQLLPVEGAGSGLKGSDGLLFDALSLETSFGAVCEQLELQPLAAARAIQTLRLMGAVRLVRSRESELRDGPDLLDPDEDSIRECVAIHVKLLAELAGPIVAVEGAEPVRQRFERVMEETAHRFPTLLAGMHAGPQMTLDPEEITRRALRLADDRELQVRSALGELVSYLEFELKNHPRIPDPERHLAAVEELRIKL